MKRSGTHPLLFAALLICVAADASAQAIYKEVSDEGQVTFTDQPSVKSDPTPAKSYGPPRRRVGKVDTSEAARRLKQARLERELGARPRPGELKPGASGHEVNYRYWQRQEKLRINVERALRRSNETLRLQVASR